MSRLNSLIFRLALAYHVIGRVYSFLTDYASSVAVTHTPQHHHRHLYQLHRHGTQQHSLGSTRRSAIVYDEPVFRPPAEWRSLILQATRGCSWNKCTFCEMYQTKEYRAKSLEDVVLELDSILAAQVSMVRDVFLADGDAMTLPTKHLFEVLHLIKEKLPHVRRISSYCLPRNIKYKSVEDLRQLQQAGLSLVYVECESGNDEVLRAVQKGETYDSSLDALTKLHDAGIKQSVMILLGLGGARLSRGHAISSAQLCSVAAPEFLSVLTISFPRGMDRVQKGYNDLGVGDSTTTTAFQPLSARDGLEELKVFLEHVDITTNKTVFRSDHASNYLALKGRLGREKETLLEQLNTVLNAPEEDDVYNLKPEWARGL